MKVKDITEPGFYLTYNLDILYEVFKNTDKEWLREEPDSKLLIDEWNRRTDNFRGSELTWYESTGSLYSLYYDYANTDVFKTCRKYRIFGPGACYLHELPPVTSFYK